MTGAEIIIKCLVEQGVDTIFGYPGGTILNIYDALYDCKEIKHYLTSHEQGASHAADGYARATGKVGVCFATSGPGATNLVTGLATAYMDSIPMVAITCNVAKSLLGRDSFQEVDITGITMPITKHNYIVESIDELASIVREAFYIAKSGRQGPVLIDIPKDITAEMGEYVYEKTKEYVPVVKISEDKYISAVKLIEKSKKPFIMAGGGIISADASNELVEFVNKINCPISTTLMGTGAYPQDNDLYVGMPGMHGTKATNVAISECDLLIAIGARFSDRVISKASHFAEGAEILHIDIDAAEINKNVRAKFDLVGDAKIILTELNNRLKNGKHDEWNKKIIELKKAFPNINSENSDKVNAQYVMEKICEETKERKPIITTEVGQNQMWAAQFFTYTKPRTFLSSGGLGTMGFGLGASMGACVGKKDSLVFNISGDGCFRMNCNELSTLQYYNIPVIIVILNNKTLGMVRQWQTLLYNKRYSQTDLDRGPNFKKLAEAYEIAGYEVDTKEEFDKALLESINSGKPSVIDVHIDKDAFVLPMVSPNKPITNQIHSVDL
ncbi:MAG: biosynthetic-type acetolactate synthase large subunit [Clostridia bacterium]